jgi:hypothetical protein
MELNYTIIIAAAVAHFILGMLWYSPKVFGTQWMKLAELDNSKWNKHKMTQSMILGFISSLIFAGVFQFLLAELGITELNGALKMAAILWLGFSATAVIGSFLWEMRPLQLFVLNAGYTLTSFLLVAAIIVSL